MRVFRIGIAATAIAALGMFGAPPAHAALQDQELKCSATLAKSFSKLQSSVLKTLARCHNDDISGKADSPDACNTLNADAVASIDKAKAKLVKKVAKACSSECSTSDDKACVTRMSCPALHVAAPANNAIAEGCSEFDIRSLDWPGPYCEAILGHPMRGVNDIPDCMNALVDSTAAAIDENVYADIDETSLLSGDSAKCVSSISKATSKAISSAYLATASCRDTRRSANSASTLPYACAAEDPDVIASVSSAITKMNDSIAKACTNADIAAITGLCGGANPSTVGQAQTCLTSMVKEIATEERGYNRHVYSPIGMLNATHPGSAQAYCGDGLVTEKREEHTGVGEECDGSDAPCGGGTCIPPGDVFECTCDTVSRERFIVDGSESKTDSDAGWLGTSHEATHNDGFGYVTELSNCTCDAFSQATCTTPSGDNECDVRGNMAPRCSDDIDGTDTCDDRGNGDGSATDSDCFRCDDYSLNAGQWCANGTNANETLCQSQCIVDATGLPTMPATPCTNQQGCGEGETCRGRCDNTITCNIMTEGSPLPLISAANPVCVMLEYQTDVTGTKDIVTGSTEVHYTTRSQITLGLTFAEPCPICAGQCIGGPSNGESCFGRCDVSGDSCLFDSDCTGPGDTTCLESNAECSGGFCSLSLRCSAGPNEGSLCRPDTTTVLGIVSHDCPPNEPISGIGVHQPFGTVTSGEVEFPAGSACTDPSWINYDCPCPANVPPNTGVPTRPNSCSAACDAGVNAGQGCVTGGGSTGQYTTCVGGGDAGKPCDANSDCDSANCSGQNKHCTGGSPVEEFTACTTNADCGGGGTCVDPCPGGRCVPLCLQEGRCNGGARDGDVCSTDDHCKECTGGNANLLGAPCDSHSRCDSTPGSGDGLCTSTGTCDLFDPEDGLCASGPTKFRCNGPGYGTIPCTLEYGTCTSGLCTMGSPSLRGDPCITGANCIEQPNVPVSSGCEDGIDALPGTADDIPGAGTCEPRTEDCFYDNGHAVGGDTVNGDGSPTDVNINACFCTPPNSNSAVNAASGFGGPSRVRRQGTAVVNVPSIP